MTKKFPVNWKTTLSISLLFLLVASIAVMVNYLPKVRPTQPRAAQLEIPPSKDTWTMDNSCCLDFNYGSQIWLETGPHSTGYHSLLSIEFSLSSLPAGSTINSAQLQLFQSGAGTAATDNDQSVIRNMTGPWTETGITARNRPGTGSDYGACTISKANGWKSWNITSLVRDWVAGTKPNYGFYVIVPGNNVDTFRTFYSREFSDSNYRPKLIVDYTPPPPLCSNECSPSGAKQCAGNTQYQTCGNYDADCGLEWSPIASCPSGQTCSGGSCISSQPPKPKPPGPTPPGPGPSGVLNSLQLTLSVSYLVGEMKIPVKVGSFSGEVTVSPDKKDYSLDVKEANLALGNPLTIVVGGNKILIKKIQITPTAESTAVNVGDLTLGDITGDNKIDDKDTVSLLDSITKQTSKGDLNADKITNSLDWAILLFNFGKSGDL